MLVVSTNKKMEKKFVHETTMEKPEFGEVNCRQCFRLSPVQFTGTLSLLE